MKITREEFEDFENLIKDLSRSGIAVGIPLVNAEAYFEDNPSANEYVLYPKLSPKAVALILAHLDKKYQKKSNTLVVDCSSGNDHLESILSDLSKAKEGTKISLLIYDGGHWRTVYCERRNNQNHVAVIDSLGILIGSNPVEEVLSKNPILRENSVLYRSVNKMQVAENNCGIFAIRAAQKLNKETDFFAKLEQGNLILSNEQALSHFKKSNQNNPDFVKRQEPVNHHFVLPPLYFSLAQRKAYLTHYKNEFGDRAGLKNFEHKVKSGEVLNIDDLFNRKERDKELSDDERTLRYHSQITAQKEDSNSNVVYFSNKYIEWAIFEMARENRKSNPNIKDQERRLKLKEKINNEVQDYLYRPDIGITRIVQMNASASVEDLVKAGDTIESVILRVSKEEAEALNEQKKEHQDVLLSEVALDNQLNNGEMATQELKEPDLEAPLLSTDASAEDLGIESVLSEVALDNQLNNGETVTQELIESVLSEENENYIPSVAKTEAVIPNLDNKEDEAITKLIERYGKGKDNILAALKEEYKGTTTENGMTGLFQHFNIKMGNVYVTKRNKQMESLATLIENLQNDQKLNNHEKGIILTGALNEMIKSIEAESNRFKSRMLNLCSNYNNELSGPNSVLKTMDADSTIALYNAYKEGVEKFKQAIQEQSDENKMRLA